MLQAVCGKSKDLLISRESRLAGEGGLGTQEKRGWGASRIRIRVEGAATTPSGRFRPQSLSAGFSPEHDSFPRGGVPSGYEHPLYFQLAAAAPASARPRFYHSFCAGVAYNTSL